MAADFDVDLGGIPSAIGLEHRMIPTDSSPDFKQMTIVKEVIKSTDEQLLQFILNREVTLVPLPDILAVRNAFDDVLSACRDFQSIRPSTWIVSSEDIDWNAVAKGAPMPCCSGANEKASAEQLRLMDTIHAKYQRFLELAERTL